MSKNPTIGMFVGDEEIERRKRDRTTPLPDKQPAAETLDQISRRLVIESGLKLYGKRRQSLEDLIFHAMRSRDERAVRIIDEHQAMGVCKDNCWTTIKAAIREGN